MLTGLCRYGDKCLKAHKINQIRIEYKPKSIPLYLKKAWVQQFRNVKPSTAKYNSSFIPERPKTTGGIISLKNSNMIIDRVEF